MRGSDAPNHGHTIARFRVKKKQWTLNLERSITDLSGRVEELEREAAELRRENGWLKEIVMLKSKRITGHAPQTETSTSQSREGQDQDEENETPESAARGEPENGGDDSNNGMDGGKGKEVQR